MRLNLIVYICLVGYLFPLQGAEMLSLNDNEREAILGKQVWIPSGDYHVGGKNYRDNQPLRSMRFNGFFIDIHPVTNKQYARFVKESGYRPTGGYSSTDALESPYHPATGLTYQDASAYAKFYKMRLPSEWEWEIASRGLKAEARFVYPSDSKSFRKRGHFYHNMNHQTVAVCSYTPNELGLFDMAGNVYEWTSSLYDSDRLHGKYQKEFTVRVLRGGAWTSKVHEIMVTTRTPFPSKRSLRWLGFRCVRDR